LGKQNNDIFALAVRSYSGVRIAHTPLQLLFLLSFAQSKKAQTLAAGSLDSNEQLVCKCQLLAPFTASGAMFKIDQN